MKKAAKLIVKGTVQGIFFRQFIKEHADDLKLKGFARNLTCGDVEIIVEGEDDAIERFMRFIQKGQSMHRLDMCRLKKGSGQEILRNLRFFDFEFD